jgi:hypothetical protein
MTSTRSGCDVVSAMIRKITAGAVEGQVAGFVEHRGRATAVVAAGVGLCALAGQAAHVTYSDPQTKFFSEFIHLCMNGAFIACCEPN